MKKLTKENLKKLILKEIRASLEPTTGEPTVWYIRNMEDYRGSWPIGYAISQTQKGAVENFLARNPDETDTLLVAVKYNENSLRRDLEDIDGEMRSARNRDARIRTVLQQLNVGQEEY